MRWWLPPLLWSAVILAASSDAFSSGSTGGTMRGLLESLLGGPLSDRTFEVVQFVIRKLTHLLAYGILGALTLRAIRRGRAGWDSRWLLAALAFALVLAIVDETHQSLVPSRTGSPGDVVIDVAGALVAGLAMRRAAR